MLQKFWGSRSPPRGGVGDQHDVATHGENAVLVGLAPGKPTEQKNKVYLVDIMIEKHGQ